MPELAIHAPTLTPNAVSSESQTQGSAIEHPRATPAGGPGRPHHDGLQSVRKPACRTLGIRATTRSDMDDQISRAVEILIPEALLLGAHGILVTRHSATDCTVAIHPDVPRGDIHERQDW